MSKPQKSIAQPEVAATESEPDAAEQTETSKIQRRGDVNKCPVCGSQVDADAFHCPTCRSYFCYHCRARLLKPDRQLQCVSQGCDYYGKLVCSICDPENEKEEDPSVYAEPEDGYWPVWLVATLIVSGAMWYFTSSFLWGLGTWAVLYILGGYGLQRAGMNLFGAKRIVEYHRKSSFHTCVHCHEPVKELQDSI